MEFFVQFGVYIKPSSVLEWTDISTFLWEEIKFSYSFYFFDTENIRRLADHEMFEKYDEAQYQRLIVS